MKLEIVLVAASFVGCLVTVSGRPLSPTAVASVHVQTAAHRVFKRTEEEDEQGDSDSSHVGSEVDHVNIVPNPAPMASMHHGTPILEDPNLEPQQKAYWEQYNTTTFFSAVVPNKGFLYAHILLNTIAWVFLAPVVVMLSVEKFSLYLVFQTLQSSVALAALFMLAIFSTTVPADLYPNNAYAKMSIIMFFVVIVHYLAALVRTLSSWTLKYYRGLAMDGTDYVLANLRNNGRSAPTQRRRSQDSGHDSFDIDEENDVDNANRELRDDIDRQDDYESSLEDTGLVRRSSNLSSDRTNTLAAGFEHRFQDKYIAKIMKNPKVTTLVSRTDRLANVVYSLINRPLLLFAYIYLLTGVAISYRVGMSNEIYNVLAHYIKGSIFFVFGIVTLARYLGAFASRGMAWNIKPGSPFDESIRAKDSGRVPVQFRTEKPSFLQKLGYKIPSMEFVECGSVFIYGITNVFLEHLGNRDGKWSHKDLQHASIAFMYIGGGLCGLLVEAGAFGRLKDSFISSESAGTDSIELRRQNAYSFNPFAAFIVFWTGVLMSKHEQSLPLSTEIHAQWGTLFCVGAVFRLFTYLIIFLTVPNSTRPTKPFTELIVSFCLICGGLVFIQSSSQSVEGMIYRNLDGMFTLNVNVGVTALIMAWEMVVFAIKGWAAKRRVD